MSLVEWIKFPVLGDERGSLVVAESNINVPFAIERIYYIFNTQKDTPRGFHAHYDLKQVAICLSGSCRMLLDNGQRKDEVWLDSSTKGLVIDKRVWHEMHEFSEDCILLVLASAHYSEADYIRDYDKFLEVVNG
mgnify:FL=1